MTARATLLALLAATALSGCGRVPSAVSTTIPKNDWSGVAASASCSPERSPTLGADKNDGFKQSACDASIEAQNPLGYVLTTRSADFRRAEEAICNTQRLAPAGTHR